VSPVDGHHWQALARGVGVLAVTTFLSTAVSAARTYLRFAGGGELVVRRRDGTLTSLTVEAA
jgi:hypothetical protein